MRHIERFEHAAAHAALRHGLVGVIRGHLHRSKIRSVDGIRYARRRILGAVDRFDTGERALMTYGGTGG